MKLSAIKRVCKARNEYIIYNTAHGEQWIGTSRDAYEVQGVRLDEKCLGALLDVSQAEINDNARVEEFESSPLCPREDEEPIQLEGAPGLKALGVEMAAFSDGSRLYLLESMRLKPTGGANSAYESHMLTHNAAGEPLILASDGMICGAILKPMPEDTTEIILSMLRRMGALTSGSKTEGNT